MIDKTDLRLSWKDGSTKLEVRIENDQLHMYQTDDQTTQSVHFDRFQMRQFLRLLEVWDESNI